MEQLSPMPTISRLLTVEEVAPMLRKTETQLRWMLHAGTAPRSAKIGGRRLFKASDVEAYINAAFETEAKTA